MSLPAEASESAMPHLTWRTVEALHASDKDVVVWDSELRGFGLRIRVGSGRRYYVVKYRIGSRQRWETLGQHGALTAEQARRLASKVLGQVREGIDPAAVRRARRDGARLAQLAERYLRDHAELKKRPSSVVSDRQLLRLRILPRLGGVPVAEISRTDIERFHRELGRSHPTQANRALSLVSKMLNLAELWGLRTDGSNPCRHVERFREVKRERFLSPAEISRLGAALAHLEREQGITAAVAAAVRILLLTGARRGEILQLRWEYVDLTHACLRLPDSKSGAKTIALSAAALDVLASLERRSDWMFPTQRGDLPVDLSRPWDRIRARAKLPKLRLHDLRHSHASVLATDGVPLLVIGRILGHKVPATTARYAHLADDPVRKAVEAAGDRIAAALSDAAAHRNPDNDGRAPQGP